MIQNNISRTTKLSLFHRMMRVRLFEEKIVELYPEQEMRCPVHLSIGQEATAAGVCEALNDSDLIFGNHRSHGHYIAKMGNLSTMLAEIYGKSTGCGKGIGGSMHLLDPEKGIVATTPIVGGIIPVSVGAALASKIKKDKKVTTLFLGDGSIEEGVFHESMNFAVLKNLPIYFFCENNFYSVYTHLRDRQPESRQIAEFVKGYGVPTRYIDGNDVEEVYNTTLAALDHIKSGKGPFFVEAITYRWREHCGPNYDNHIGYRTEQEFLEWKKKCPIDLYKHKLLKQGFHETELDSITAKIQSEVNEAACFAKESPFPDREFLSTNVYAPNTRPS